MSFHSPNSLFCAVWVAMYTLGFGCGPVASVSDRDANTDDPDAQSPPSDAQSPSPDAQTYPPYTPPEGTIFVLVHPSNSPPLGPGVYVYNEVSNTVGDIMALPTGASSPHALEFDGRSLWLATHLDNGQDALFELDPTDGSTRQSLSGIFTEGLVADGETLWRGADDLDTMLIQFQKSGVEIRTFPVQNIINALTTDGQYFYYIANDSRDPILRVDQNGVEVEITDASVSSLAPYSLDYDGEYLVVVDESGGGNALRRIDKQTGDTVELVPLPITGWITDIAFAGEPEDIVL